MRLALVVVKENTRRAVHLADNDPLCTINDKRTVWGHQRHIAHEHILFLDILDGLRTSVFVDIKHDQAQRHLERRAVGHVALLAFLDVVLGLFQIILDVFQNRRFVKVFYRKDGLKNTLNTVSVGGDVGIARIQKQIIGRFLNLYEVWHFQDFTDFTVIFTKTFLAKERLRHTMCHLSVFLWMRAPSGPGALPRREDG